MWKTMGPSGIAMLFLLGLVPQYSGKIIPIKIGAIFHQGDEDLQLVFESATGKLERAMADSGFKIQAIIKTCSKDAPSYSVQEKVCELIEEGVVVIFGPRQPEARDIVSSITSHFHIPHVEYYWRRDAESDPSPTTINVYPDSKNIPQAIAALVKTKEWPSFAAIYETDDGLSRIQEALALHDPSDLPVTVRQLNQGSDYRPILKELANSSVSNVLLDVENENILNVLKQAKEVKLLKDQFQYVITDLNTKNLPLRDTFGRTAIRTNITGFNILTDEGIQLGIDLNITPTVEAALLYDSVFLLEGALVALKKKDSKKFAIVPESLSCEGEEKYEAGKALAARMREPSRSPEVMRRTPETTGRMEFDEKGRRILIADVVEYVNNDFVETGYWRDEKLTHFRTAEQREQDLAKALTNQTFIVSTKVEEPFLMIATDEDTEHTVQINGKKYKGYSVDLIHKIAEIMKIKYEFELVPDGSTGKLVNGKWDGLVKRLIDKKAHLAICDFTITHARESAVDFTTPFMSLGISILFRKMDKPPKSLFSFLSPFEANVWIYMAAAYLGVSLMLFLQARMAPGEWDSPHPCNPEPEELENSFNLMNSFWLTMGSLMQQGSDILPKAAPGEWSPPHPCVKEPTELEYSLNLSNSLWHNIGSLMQQGSDITPKAPSIRMVAGMWWFFTLIMVSSYTANLAAFLTQEKMEVTINNAEDLAKQTDIKYGAMYGGSTYSFFQNSSFTTYQRMWAFMVDHPEVFTSSNVEGVKKVQMRKGKYAFLMESATIDYHLADKCDLMQVGDNLDNKGYGIAMPLNSSYRSYVNEAVLKLQENQQLSELKDKWWSKNRPGGGEMCKRNEVDTEKNSNELGLKNVGGVFIVLMFGCAVSCIVGIIEFLWNVQKVAVEEKVTPREALRAELKFAVNIWDETKPVKVAQSSSGTSSSTGGIGRAASVARSMVGSFLRLDILDKFDRDNESNTRNTSQRMN